MARVQAHTIKEKLDNGTIIAQRIRNTRREPRFGRRTPRRVRELCDNLAEALNGVMSLVDPQMKHGAMTQAKKILNSYASRSEGRNRPVGWLVAIMESDTIKVGWSLQHQGSILMHRKITPIEPWDGDRGLETAYARARQAGVQVTIDDDIIPPPGIPHTVAQHMPNFIARCIKYFKSANVLTGEWHRDRDRAHSPFVPIQ